MIKIGVLALQGDFSKHKEALSKLGVVTIEVRSIQDLEACDALVIPGGESTCLTRLLVFSGLNRKIQEFAQRKPIFGTCAGLIVMAKESSKEVLSLGLLDITVDRNAYGRQTESFSAEITINSSPFTAFFIRAPQISTWNKEVVSVLASYEDKPVLVSQGLHLAATFHPELTSNLLVHDLFLQRVKEFT